MTDTHEDWTTEEDADAGWVSDVDEGWAEWDGDFEYVRQTRRSRLKVGVAILFAILLVGSLVVGRPLALGRAPDQPTRRSGCQAHRDDRPGRDDVRDR